jgi:hypothetical protein
MTDLHTLEGFTYFLFFAWAPFLICAVRQLRACILLKLLIVMLFMQVVHQLRVFLFEKTFLIYFSEI